MSDAVQKALYLKIDPYERISRLLEIDGILKSQYNTLDRTSIEGLGKAADLNFRLLAKVLPDQKAVEVRGDPQAPVTFTFAGLGKPSMVAQPVIDEVLEADAA
jgi:hypothetical protein